jgi:hypothetical protein
MPIHPAATTVAALLCSLAVLPACGDDSAQDEAAHRGRGSVACQDWQDAVCDLASDRCGAIDRATCDAQYQGVVCRSDELASQCSNALNEASCTSAPLGCDVTDLADRAPAVAACNELLDAICARQARCGLDQPLQECLAEQRAQLGFDCQDALAVDLRYEQCLSMLEPDGCAPVMGATCAGVIRVAP